MIIPRAVIGPISRVLLTEIAIIQIVARITPRADPEDVRLSTIGTQ